MKKSKNEIYLTIHILISEIVHEYHQKTCSVGRKYHYVNHTSQNNIDQKCYYNLMYQAQNYVNLKFSYANPLHSQSI